MDNNLATWYFEEDVEKGHEYPQMSGITAGSKAFNTTYWRCVYCLYETSLLTQEDINYYFFTNTDVPEDVDGVDLKKFMDDNEIRVVKLEYTCMPPDGWDEWWTQFFELDILRYCRDIAGNWLMLDSDCIIRKSLKPIFKLIQEKGGLSYQIDRAGEGERKIYEMVFGENASNLQHIGGEFIGVRSDNIDEMLSLYDILWKENLKQFYGGKLRLNTEEDFFSLIYYKMGFNYEGGAAFIKRMWGNKIYDNICAEDVEMTIWHLPAEKKRTFVKLFKFFQGKKEKRAYSEYVEKLLAVREGEKGKRIRGHRTLKNRINSFVYNKILYRKKRSKHEKHGAVGKSQ